MSNNNNFKIQERLKLALDISQYTPEEMKYLLSPIGKAIYEKALSEKGIENNIKKTELNIDKVLTESEVKRTKFIKNQKIKCDTCGVQFTRANRSAHVKTKVHNAYESMNNKLKKFLLDK